MERKSFLDQEAPAGYIAGLGRGATGFTTSADIGSARIRPGIVTNSGDGDNEDRPITVASDEDDSGLLLNGESNKEDEEADKIFEEIDNRMKLRNKKKRDFQGVLEDDKVHEISEQFIDLKRNLATISADQWANLPEVGDLTRRNKRSRIHEQSQQRSYAVPDTVLSSMATMGTNDKSIDLRNEETDFQSISSGRDKLLSLKLDALAGFEYGGTNKDDLLLELSKKDTSEQVGDIAKARLILSSLRKSDPTKADGWVSSARLEEQAKKFDQAKKLIQEGCNLIKFNETLWLENIRLNQSDIKLCKIIAREAIQFNSKSQRLWLKACDLENEINSKKKIIRKGLEHLPTDAALWRRMIDLEDDQEDVKKILGKALEMCPSEIDLWVTLVNLEDVDNAKKILNKARKAVPKSHEIWIIAAKLEEKSNATENKIIKLLDKGIKEIINNGNRLSRDTWIQEAASAESEGFIKTCHGILKSVIETGLEDLDDDTKLTTLLDEANEAFLNQYYEVSNYIYELTIDKFPHNIDAWMKLLNTIKSSDLDDPSKFYSFCEKAVKSNPDCEVLWLMYAKEKWVNGDLNSARKILNRSMKSDILQHSADIYFAATKLEFSDKNYKRVDILLGFGQDMFQTPRVFQKYATFKRQMGKNEDALKIIETGLKKYPSSDKLYMQKGQILEEMDKLKEARDSYSAGTRECPNSIALWLLLSRIDEFKFKIFIRARSVLDMALTSNPKSDDLWVEKIRLEKRQGNMSQARALTSRALKELPESGNIWFEHLALIEKKSHRKNAFLDALKATKNSSRILLAFGYFFWIDGKFSNSKLWFQRAVDADRDNGDNWAWLYAFTSKYGAPEDIEKLIVDFEKADPHHGEIWCSSLKDIKNMNKPIVEILKMVSEQVIST